MFCEYVKSILVAMFRAIASLSAVDEDTIDDDSD